MCGFDSRPHHVTTTTCDHADTGGCPGGRCCYCDGLLQHSLSASRGFRWLPCQRDHEYWRRRITTLVLLPALHRYVQRRIDDLLD